MGKWSRELSVVLDFGLCFPSPDGTKYPDSPSSYFQGRGTRLEKAQMGVRAGFWGLW